MGYIIANMHERFEICVGILREAYPFYQDLAVATREDWYILSYAKSGNKVKFMLWDTPNGLFLEERDLEKRSTRILRSVEPGELAEVLEKLSAR